MQVSKRLLRALKIEELKLVAVDIRFCPKMYEEFRVLYCWGEFMFLQTLFLVFCLKNLCLKDIISWCLLLQMDEPVIKYVRKLHFLEPFDAKCPEKCFKKLYRLVFLMFRTWSRSFIGEWSKEPLLLHNRQEDDLKVKPSGIIDQSLPHKRKNSLVFPIFASRQTYKVSVSNFTLQTELRLPHESWEVNPLENKRRTTPDPKKMVCIDPRAKPVDLSWKTVGKLVKNHNW